MNPVQRRTKIRQNERVVRLAHRVSDKASNKPENIQHAMQVLGRSADRRKVFEAIYFGKTKAKTIMELAEITGLTAKRVAEEANRLAQNEVARRTKKDGKLAYAKDPFLANYKAKILSHVGKPEKIAAIRTKRSNGVRHTEILKLKVISRSFSVQKVTVDDVENFAAVRSVPQASVVKRRYERDIKSLFKKVIGETGSFKDWGGEINDLYTTRVRIGEKRYHAAFAFKGKGTKGKLTPRQMGKNADQIQRLFQTVAQVFFVQYTGQVDQSVADQMQTYATVKSIHTGDTIFYGIIDGQDTERMFAAYE